MKHILLCLLLAINTFSSVSYAKPQEQSLDQMVAVVNEDLITRSELNRAIDIAKIQMEQTGVSIPPTKALEKQVLDSLINKKVLLQAAQQAGITISNTELDEAIKQIADQNNISSDDLYKGVEQDGYTTASYRREIREQIMIQKIKQSQIVGKVSVSPEEVTAFMKSSSFKQNAVNEYRLQDILIPISDSPSSAELAAAKTRADIIMQKLKSGADFSSIAKAESSGTNALQGGDLGWLKLPEIPSAFTDHVAGMKKHDLAGPIQTGNGFHILMLTDLRKLDEDNQTLKDRKTVERMLLQQKFEQALQSFVSRLRSQAFITTEMA